MQAYKVKDNLVIEVGCEEMKYPLYDNDGDMIYENTHFKTEQQAYESAIKNCEAGVSLLTSSIKDNRDKVKKLEVLLADECIDLERLRKELRCLISEY